ncbi:unnamed protein product [Phytophthora lilii]|uniref:Unnamed protein product n=1 Tax=Phytophthora lilii TaxID=2077276 RepID=A0A9W6TD97_9STRA|nr:unnamed protein product [Phytophthora lilii]
MQVLLFLTVSYNSRPVARPWPSENGFDAVVMNAALDLVFDKKSRGPDSTVISSFRQQKKQMPDSVRASFPGSISVGGPTTNHIPPGGYIVMVLTEDLDPSSGAVLRDTMAMVMIEDIDAEKDSHFNISTKGATKAIADAVTPAVMMTTRLAKIYDNKAYVAADFISRWWKDLLLRCECLPIEQLDKALYNVHHSHSLAEIAPAVAVIQARTSTSAECCARCLKTPLVVSLYNLIIRMSSQASSLTVLYNVLNIYSHLTCFRRSSKPPPIEYSPAGLLLDLLWMELLVDVMVLFIDQLQLVQDWNWLVITAAANALWNVLSLLQPCRLKLTESWRRTQHRLTELQQSLANSDPATARPSLKQFRHQLTRIVANLAKLTQL